MSKQREVIEWTAPSGIVYELDISFDYGVDDNYGADADNRGGVSLEEWTIDNYETDPPLSLEDLEELTDEVIISELQKVWNVDRREDQ